MGKPNHSAQPMPDERFRSNLQPFLTRHWLSAILASRRPDLLSRLPPSYAIGHGPCPGLRPTTSAFSSAISTL